MGEPLQLREVELLHARELGHEAGDVVAPVEVEVEQVGGEEVAGEETYIGTDFIHQHRKTQKEPT